MDTTENIRLGPFELDRRSLELRRAGEVVPLEPLPARLLVHLAERPGSLVDRGELLELGWPRLPGAAEQSLNTCIYQIRQALDDGGQETVRVETLRGRGYRLTVVAGYSDGESATGTLRVGGRLRAVAGVVVLLAGALGLMRMGADAPIDTEVAAALERAEYLLTTTGDLVGARAVLDSARIRFAQVPEVQARWAESSLMIGDLNGAREAAGKALDLDGSSVVGLRVQGMLALLDRDPAGADRLLHRALALGPHDAGTLAALAYRHAIAGDFDEALVRLEEALRAEPLSTVLQRDAGLLFLLAGRYQPAEVACREVLRFEPRSAWAVDCLFDLMVLTGRPDQAARWGRRLMEVQGAAPPPEGMGENEVIALVERWRMEAWEGAVERGAYPLGLVYAYAANGRVADALGVLRRTALDPRPGLLAVGVDPRLAGLRHAPAFHEIVGDLSGSGS